MKKLPLQSARNGRPHADRRYIMQLVIPAPPPVRWRSGRSTACCASHQPRRQHGEHRQHGGVLAIRLVVRASFHTDSPIRDCGPGCALCTRRRTRMATQSSRIGHADRLRRLRHQRMARSYRAKYSFQAARALVGVQHQVGAAPALAAQGTIGFHADALHFTRHGFGQVRRAEIPRIVGEVLVLVVVVAFGRGDLDDRQGHARRGPRPAGPPSARDRQ